MRVSAADKSRRLFDLLAVQGTLKEKVRTGRLRSDNAQRLVDFAFEQTIFTVRQVQRHLAPRCSLPREARNR